MGMIMRSGVAVVVAGLALVAPVAQAQSTFAVPPGVTFSAGGVSVGRFCVVLVVVVSVAAQLAV